MELQLDYGVFLIIVASFVGLGIIVGLGIVFIKSSFDDIGDKIELFKQTIREIFDLFRK